MYKSEECGVFYGRGEDLYEFGMGEGVEEGLKVKVE